MDFDGGTLFTDPTLKHLCQSLVVGWGKKGVSGVAQEKVAGAGKGVRWQAQEKVSQRKR